MTRIAERQFPRERQVQILSGVWPGFIGVVKGELPERGQVTVFVSLFNKPTAVKRDRTQVKVIQ